MSFDIAWLFGPLVIYLAQLVKILSDTIHQNIQYEIYTHLAWMNCSLLNGVYFLRPFLGR